MASKLSVLLGKARVTMLTLCLGAALAACANGPSMPSENAPMTAANPAEGYLLEPGNRVRIMIFGESNMSGDFLVDTVGTISMPLIGNIAASGTTVQGLSKRIEEKLKQDGYLKEPRINVEILTFRPFYVLGEVRQPGEFPYSNGMTVLSAIARAGGYDYRARQSDVVLVRMVNGQQKDYRATERTPILPGDIVRVLERAF
ncbi:polysaccharide biosynthesis/export family protein [Lacibacterium aquatile]|uniref:Polysaccharide biosynthesis/export family protein n=1 Tax=Lacibacterium aquatile TaxID=1168082 RepID=A0ABW5DZU6_9PROT